MSREIIVQVHSPEGNATGGGSSTGRGGVGETKVDSLVGDDQVHKIVSVLRAKIDKGRLEEGSSKAIRKAMEVAASFAVKGSQKKDVVLAALNLLSAHAPEKWQATLGVASTQVDELFKLAQGLSSLNANSTLADVKTQLDALAASKALTSCFPCFKKSKK